MSGVTKLAVASADERTLRALVRESIRVGVAVTADEEQAVEDEFIRLVQERCGAKPDDRSDADGLEKWLDYTTPLGKAIDEQVWPLYEAQAIVELAVDAMKSEFGTDWPSKLPNFPLALGRVSKTILEVTEALEAPTLRDRALAIATDPDAAAKREARS